MQNAWGGGGTLALTMSGAGMQTLSGGNIAYTGATSVTSGTLSVQDTTNFASAINVGPNGTLNLIRTSTGFGSRSTIAASAITGSGVINVNSPSSGIGGGWVIMNGASALNFSGTININSGVLATDNGGGVQGTANVNVAQGGVMALHNATNGWTIGALNGAGDVTPAQGTNGPTYNLTVGAGNATGSFSGIIHGNNSTASSDGSMEAGYLTLTKVGSGTQILSGSNTYTGNTTISGGTLTIGGAGVLGGGNYSGAISNSGAFVMNTTANQTLAGAISGSGPLFQLGSGITTLTATNTYTGATTVNAGVLSFGQRVRSTRPTPPVGPAATSSCKTVARWPWASPARTPSRPPTCRPS